MDFELSEEHKMLAKSVRDFMEREIAPIATQIDRKDELPDGIWKRMGSLGFLGVTIPQKYEGAGFDYLAHVVAAEEMSRICPGLAFSVGGHGNICCDNLYKSATEEQRHKYLPPLCRGELIGAMALTEPNFGSDAVGIQMTAKKVGVFCLLNGTKTLITNGPIADIIVLYAKTAPEKGSKGITAFIVEKGFKGSFNARHIEKVGHRGSPMGELVFEDYHIPADNILGEENSGIRVMMNGLDTERILLAGLAAGITRKALELSVKYAKERIQFGRPIGKFELIQAKLADMYTMLEASRLLAYKAAILAWKSERGGRGTELHKLAAAAHLLSSETVLKAAVETVQIHGGYGYTMENPVNQLLRDAKLYQLAGGTSEIRRLIIAEALLEEV